MEAARASINLLGLDKLIFIPAKQPNNDTHNTPQS